MNNIMMTKQEGRTCYYTVLYMTIYTDEIIIDRKH